MIDLAGQPTPIDEGDVIYASAGNDTIDAAGGNNLIDGGVGDDALTGGAGDDSYVIDSTGDVIIENPNEGSDIVYACPWRIRKSSQKRIGSGSPAGAARAAPIGIHPCGPTFALRPISASRLLTYFMAAIGSRTIRGGVKANP